MNISLDISKKIEPKAVAVIADLNTTMLQANVEFMIIGASARDMVFEDAFGIRTTRATMDTDFAVHLATWAKHTAISEALLASKRFTKDVKQRQRYHHINGHQIDVVPFGDLEDHPGMISWPPDGDFEMSTIGLKEALSNALDFCIRTVPELTVKVCPPFGMAALKLISWNDRKQSPQGAGDAQDLAFVLRNYADVDSIHPEGVASIADVPPEDLDYERASAWLVGKHISQLMRKGTSQRLINILDDDGSSGLDTLAYAIARQEARIELENATESIKGLLVAFRNGLA